MVAAYSLAEKAAAEYKTKVVEKIGAKKEQTIRDEVAQDQVTNKPMDRTIIVESGEVPCMEAYTGRYFSSSMETIKQAVNNLNYMVNNNFYASLTDFYNMLGLPRTEISDEVGWNSDKLMDISFSTAMDKSGKPVLVMSYHVVPIRNYYRVS